ncbi:unnamed protein product [Nesidiocoris tenuis]|uniref:RNA-directed DNA polymerase n=1 Tax=Nesidiocoris tenuis TaxID=355587 RepID=A0A6H5HYX2_9HEMI|nr:unnamed protein product [Nesidiocoris tenuis]
MPPLPPPVQFQLGKSSWKLFTKRTNSLFLTYSVTDPVVKKNYLLASLGDDVYNLLHSLCVPKEPEHPDYTFENLIAALTAHLRPVRSLFSARQNFYRATQSEGETVPEFSARVRQLASECEFGKELDVVCRDIFIMGLRNERVKDRLFEEDPTKADFTLQRAIEIAVAKEAVANESRASTSDFNNCQVKQEYPSCSYIRDDNCADFLSRITWSKGAVETDPGNATTYLNYVNENSPFRLDWRSIQRETRTDVELAPVVSAIQRGDKMPSDDRFAPYKRREHELTVDKSCLMWGYRVVVPSKLRSSVLSKLHETHMGATKMKSHARSFFWWPSLDRDIESVAARCETCCKFRSTPPPSVLKPWPWPSTVWTRLHIDFFGPVNQKINYFVLEDATSKWIEAFQVPSTTASVAIEKLQEIFARFGLPRAITSDGAKCFTGTEFSEFLQLYGIVHLRGPPFHPQSNGFGESAVKIVKRSVQKALASGLKPTNLSRAVNNFLFQYRNTVHAAIMDTPAGLLLKKKPMTFFDLMIPSSESVVLERQASMVKNGGHRQVFLYPNDLVWVRDYRFGQPKWIKGHIQDVLGDQTFLVKTHDNNLWSRHLDQLWPGSPRKTAPDPNVSQPNLQSPKETSQTPNEKSKNTATSTAESSADFQGFSPPSQAIEKSPTTSTPISTPQRRTTRKIRKPLRFEPR